MTVKTEISVLIIDDEESIRESLADFLEDFGFQIHTASTAEEAITIIKSKNIDVSIVDIRLPGADGNKFIAEANIINPDLKYIIHTGSVNYTMGDDVKNTGISPEDIFQKPISDLQIFVTKINSFFNK